MSYFLIEHQYKTFVAIQLMLIEESYPKKKLRFHFLEIAFEFSLLKNVILKTFFIYGIPFMFSSITVYSFYSDQLI